MGCIECTKGQTSKSTPLAITINDEQGFASDDMSHDLFSKSLASPGIGFSSPKQRFARQTSAHQGVMSSIAMKFPHIRRSFQACKIVFEKYSQIDDEDSENQQQYITKSQVRLVLLELGAAAEDLTDSAIDEIFHTADLDVDKKIDFKEFLIAAAVGCFLNKEKDGQSPDFARIRKGFEAVQLAFSRIDRDGSGRIDLAELKIAFLSMKQDDLINERLKDLDFNGDDYILFPEFVWGLSAWVNMDEDEEQTEISPTPLDLETKYCMDKVERISSNNISNNDTQAQIQETFMNEAAQMECQPCIAVEEEEEEENDF